MGRDSNPRKPCDFSGFQDRRIRPLCHPSETFFSFCRRSFKPAVLFAYRTWRCCSPLVRARLHFVCLADSYARPSHSTAATTHPKLFHFSPVFQTCNITQPGSSICITFAHRVFYTYFFRIATAKTIAPAANSIADNNVPMVSPQEVRKPICASGARNCSHTIRATA